MLWKPSFEQSLDQRDRLRVPFAVEFVKCDASVDEDGLERSRSELCFHLDADHVLRGVAHDELFLALEHDIERVEQPTRLSWARPHARKRLLVTGVSEEELLSSSLPCLAVHVLDSDAVQPG